MDAYDWAAPLFHGAEGGRVRETPENNKEAQANLGVFKFRQWHQFGGFKHEECIPLTTRLIHDPPVFVFLCHCHISSPPYSSARTPYPL